MMLAHHEFMVYSIQNKTVEMGKYTTQAFACLLRNYLMRVCL
jgi:hypothetical protein